MSIEVFISVGFVTKLGQLRPTHPPHKWVPQSLFPGVKQPGREVNSPSPLSFEVKNTRRDTYTPSYVFITWCLIEHRDYFIFLSVLS